MSPVDLVKPGQEPDYRMLVQSVPDTQIILLDPRGVVVTWNRGAEAMTGYRSAEMVGKPLRNMYVEQDRNNGLPERELQAAVDGTRTEFEGWRVRKDGKLFWISVVLTPLSHT